ncbi:hypothetical protein [Ottowia sp.]|uniref:hypothetical protein n=1 Tax=Ottowia sp. TaxID=1898956 RepID=UPI002C80E903|nr:hypothetical protein [Ottowia sp.]HOB66001.1 hypothetical protein [Ottowia sp.]HPZ56111.1 hypothetical protein [Ottowia sp.]
MDKQLLQKKAGGAQSAPTSRGFQVNVRQTGIDQPNRSHCACRSAFLDPGFDRLSPNGCVGSGLAD